MKRVAEIMYIVPTEREDFLKGALNPTEEEKKALWLCGVRKQQYFALNEFIFMTFEYAGENFSEDMSRMTAYLDSIGHLIKKRRRDVPPEERTSTNWWAPVKKLGSILETEPAADNDDDSWRMDYMAMLDGGMNNVTYGNNDTAFDEDDWTESIHI